MEAIARELNDKDGTKVYPVTKADLVFMDNGIDTVGRVLNDMKDQNTEIKFGQNNIEKTLASGSIVTTDFRNDGSIVETTKDAKGKIVCVKTTKFASDGSISIKIEGEEY